MIFLLLRAHSKVGPIPVLGPRLALGTSEGTTPEWMAWPGLTFLFSPHCLFVLGLLLIMWPRWPREGVEKVGGALEVSTHVGNMLMEGAWRNHHGVPTTYSA